MKNIPLKLLASATLGTLCTLAGCANTRGVLDVDRCADIPAGSIPEPAGTKLCEWQTAQITNALADQTVLYQCDFIGGKSTLSPAAMERIRRHANSGLAEDASWVVEPSSDATLDQARIQRVELFFDELGISNSDISIALPPAIGLSRNFAERAASGSVRNNSSGTSNTNFRR